MNIGKRLMSIIIGLVILISMGCAVKRGVVETTPPLYNKSHDKIEQTLLNRVAKYWHYRKSNMPEKSFEYEYRSIKGYKLNKTYRNYVSYMSRAKINKIEIVSMKRYKEGNCFNLKFYLAKPDRLGKKTFYKQDCWINDNETKKWFHILSNKLLFRF